jgi:hypothetical protein
VIVPEAAGHNAPSVLKMLVFPTCSTQIFLSDRCFHSRWEEN